MENLSKEQRQVILDHFGQKVIEDVRDGALKVSMDIVKKKTINPIKQKQYSILLNLTEEQEESLCDLLSETITDTIYRFLEMIEENPDRMELVIKKDGKIYDLSQVSEKMGSEIACFEANGWIQKFSKIGRFVL
jgi:hypothetical protein